LFAATIAGVIFNFFTFGRLVFYGRGFGFIFGKFFLAYVLIYGINAALLSILTKNLSLSPYLGQIICIPISVLLSWILMNYWVYKNA
jgi:putative flippase GtrA